MDVAITAIAQVEEKDVEEDNKEVLVMIKCTGGKGGGNNEDKGNNKDVFKTIEAFKE